MTKTREDYRLFARARLSRSLAFRSQEIMTDKTLIVPDAARVTTVTPWAQIAGLGSTTHTRYDDAAGSRRHLHVTSTQRAKNSTMQTRGPCRSTTASGGGRPTVWLFGVCSSLGQRLAGGARTRVAPVTRLNARARAR